MDLNRTLVRINAKPMGMISVQMFQLELVSYQSMPNQWEQPHELSVSTGH